MTAEITPEWATKVLRGSGALLSGEVVSLTQTTANARNSRASHVALTFSSTAAPELPTSVFVKQNLDAEWAVEAGQQEVAFYREIAQLPVATPMILPCFAAGEVEGTHDTYLVLADVSQTHEPPFRRDEQMKLAMPAWDHSVTATDTLAVMHATFWNRPMTSIPVGYWTRDRERWDAYVERRRRSWAKVKANNEWLPTTVVRFFDGLLDASDDYWEHDLQQRMRSGNLTLTHGDSYLENFLFPKGSGSSEVYLIDWQSPGFDLGALDLVNAHATFRTREQRIADKWEERLVLRYYETLCASGVVGYSIDDLHDDYRRALMAWVLGPVQDAGDGSAVEYWWPKMQHLIDAFDDWKCRDLLA
jgi:hypothetical protein